MTVTTGIDPARTGSGRSSSDHRSARSARRPSGRSTAGGLYGAGSYRRPSAGRGRRGRINGNEWAKRRYDISVLQAEFSLTQMLDRPVSGQVFFEEVIRENLDIGRPDHVGLVFDRQIRTRGKRPTPGRFRTRVLTAGATPSLHVDYKHSKIKQYHKQGRALRTETTINDSRDFAIGKRLCNLPALRVVGSSANRRPARRRTSHPRPDHRRRRLRRRHHPRRRGQPARVRPTVRHHPHPGPAGRPRRLPGPVPWPGVCPGRIQPVGNTSMMEVNAGASPRSDRPPSSLTFLRRIFQPLARGGTRRTRRLLNDPVIVNDASEIAGGRSAFLRAIWADVVVKNTRA